MLIIHAGGESEMDGGKANLVLTMRNRKRGLKDTKGR